MFVGLLIFFTVSSFIKSNCRNIIASDECPSHSPDLNDQSAGISGLGAMLVSSRKLQPKPKSVPEFKVHSS